MAGKTREFTRIREAYINMVTEGRYRPQAPSDGMGTVLLTEEELADPQVLAEEASDYAATFIRQETSSRFDIGTSNYSTNRALVYTIEAAKNLCGAADHVALKLLKMAIKEIEANQPAK